MFLIVTESSGLQEVSRLTQKAKDARIEISALLIGTNMHRSIGELCRETGGVAMLVASEAELSGAGHRLAARLTSFYKIDYATGGDAVDGSASPLSVQVHSEDGYGKDEFEGSLGD